MEKGECVVGLRERLYGKNVDFLECYLFLFEDLVGKKKKGREWIGDCFKKVVIEVSS